MYRWLVLFVGILPVVPQAALADLPRRGVCAHRGASTTHPENTLPALREAVRLGVQMVEFDLRLTKDGSVILMHDETVDRTTNGKGLVADLSQDEILLLDAGAWKDSRFAETRVPTFEEVMRVMPRNVWLNCHLKGGAELGKKCAQIVAASGRTHQAVLAAEGEAGRAAREAVPSILLCNMERQSDSLTYVEETISRQATFIQLLGKGDIAPEVRRKMRRTGLHVNYFGHDENPDGLRKLWNSGVHFPLVDDVASAMKIAGEFRIDPVLPVYPLETLPKEIDLRPNYVRWNMPPKSQGARNTCSVFTTVGAFEYVLSRKYDRAMPLSVEYSNWACNQIIRNTQFDRGQFFHDLLKGFDRYGLCRDELMTYEETFQNTAPTEAAQADAKKNSVEGFRVRWIRPWSNKSSLTEDQHLETLNVLALGSPVCAGSDHSRLLIGYILDPQLPGGGKYLTRDSGIGDYGEVTFEWAKAHVYDLFWVELGER